MRKYELPCASNRSTQLSLLTAVQADEPWVMTLTVALPKGAQNNVKGYNMDQYVLRMP